MCVPRQEQRMRLDMLDKMALKRQLDAIAPIREEREERQLK